MTSNRAKLEQNVKLLRECADGKWTELVKTPTMKRERELKCVLCNEYGESLFPKNKCKHDGDECPLSEDYGSRCYLQDAKTPWNAFYKDASFFTALAMRDAIVESRVRREERLRVMDKAKPERERNIESRNAELHRRLDSAQRVHDETLARVRELEKELASRPPAVERKCEMCGAGNPWVHPQPVPEVCKGCAGSGSKPNWTPSDPRDVKIIGLQTDVETLREELKRSEDRRKKTYVAEHEQYTRAEGFKKELSSIRTDLSVALGQIKGYEAFEKVGHDQALHFKREANNAIAHAEHLRKYARHTDSCSSQPSLTGSTAPCTCGFDDGPGKSKSEYADNAVDVTSKATFERLDGRNVTIQASANEDQVTDIVIGPIAVANAILEEYGVRVSYIQIEFYPRQELGVFDAKVRLGEHVATVKVWIVKRFSTTTGRESCRPKPATLETVIELIREVAYNAQPSGHLGELRDVVERCDVLFGEGS